MGLLLLVLLAGDEVHGRAIPAPVVEDRVHVRPDVVPELGVRLVALRLAPLEILTDLLGQAFEEVRALLVVFDLVAARALEGLDVSVKSKNAWKNIFDLRYAGRAP